MKQLAAISLSAVLLFNWFGFQPLMHWMDTRADMQMAKQLDEVRYNQASLIEIVVPVNLPYTNNWADFERTDGSIEYNGQQYSYVMRKMVNGNMIYKCIPNPERNKISSARNTFLKLAFDDYQIKAGAKKQDNSKAPVVKKAIDEFTAHHLQIVLAPAADNAPSYVTANVLLAHGFNVLPYQPPQG